MLLYDMILTAGVGWIEKEINPSTSISLSETENIHLTIMIYSTFAIYFSLGLKKQHCLWLTHCFPEHAVLRHQHQI